MKRGYVSKISVLATLLILGALCSAQNDEQGQRQPFVGQRMEESSFNSTAIVYAKQQLVSGKTVNELLVNLRRRGYNDQEIKDIIFTASWDVSEELKKRGMSDEEIYAYFKKRGYSSEEIEKFAGEPESVKAEKRNGLLTLLFVFIAGFLALVGIALTTARKKKTIKVKKPKSDDEGEISRLMKEKESIEYMIDLAKMKYHKREVDEESFREIVRDHQKELIEIEAQIRTLEKRVKKLERK